MNANLKQFILDTMTVTKPSFFVSRDTIGKPFFVAAIFGWGTASKNSHDGKVEITRYCEHGRSCQKYGCRGAKEMRVSPAAYAGRLKDIHEAA